MSSDSPTAGYPGCGAVHGGLIAADHTPRRQVRGSAPRTRLPPLPAGEVVALDPPTIPRVPSTAWRWCRAAQLGGAAGVAGSRRRSALTVVPGPLVAVAVATVVALAFPSVARVELGGSVLDAVALPMLPESDWAGVLGGMLTVALIAAWRACSRPSPSSACGPAPEPTPTANCSGTARRTPRPAYSAGCR